MTMTQIDSRGRRSLVLSALATFTAAMMAALLLANPAAAHSYESGPIRIDHPWAAATMPGATVGAAYMKISNTGPTPIRLLSATTSVAGSVEFHDMSMDGGVMKMRPVTDGVVIPAGGEVVFKASGMHIMLSGLKEPLVEEDFQTLTLNFEGGIEVEVELYIERGDAAVHGH